MTRPAPTVVTVSDDLDVFGVAKRWEELILATRGTDGDLVVDLGAVADLDVSGMQLLVAVQTTLTHRGGHAVFRGLKPDFVQRLSDLGLPLALEEDRP